MSQKGAARANAVPPTLTELLQRFSVIGPALVDLAVTHELGHAICQENNERNADDYGRDLRAGKVPDWQDSRSAVRAAWRSAYLLPPRMARHDRKGGTRSAPQMKSTVASVFPNLVRSPH